MKPIIHFFLEYYRQVTSIIWFFQTFYDFLAKFLDSLPDCVGKIHGNGRSDLEDLAFPIRPPREADEIGRRVCLSTWRSI